MAQFYAIKKPQQHVECKKQIDALTMTYENKLSEQKERIFNLVDENKKLTEELAKYRKKDSEISSALMLALSKAQEIENSAKQRYAMEIERLKLFHTKWVAHYEKIRKSLPADENVITAESFLFEMDKILGFKSPVFVTGEKDVAKQYLSETKRLNPENSKISYSSSKKSDDEEDFNLSDFIAASSSITGQTKTNSITGQTKTNRPSYQSENISIYKNSAINANIKSDKIKDFVPYVKSKNNAVNSESGLDLNEVLSPKNLPNLETLLAEIEKIKKK